MNTIEKLKDLYLSKGYQLSPYSKEQIGAALKQHKTLPATLIEYYSKIGAISDEDSFTIHILSPDHLRATSDGDERPRKILIFAEEMQGVITLGILKKDLKVDNPLLYGSGDVFEEYLDEEEDYEFLPGDTYAASSSDSDTTFLSLLDLLWGIASIQLGGENPMKQETLDPKIIAKKEKALARKRKEQLTTLAHDIICGDADAALLTEEMTSTVTKLVFRRTPQVELLARFVKLKSLDADFLPSPDISWISPLKEITSLNLSYLDIEDITPLRHLTKLSFALLRGNKIKDISPLASAKKLKQLFLADNEIVDTSSFLTLSDTLIELELSNNPILSIEGIQNFINLDILDLEATVIENIEPLAKLPKLRVVYLHNTSITDLSPLKDHKVLETLNISNTKVSSLAPLQNYKHRMWSLSIEGAPITDVECMKKVSIAIFEQ